MTFDQQILQILLEAGERGISVQNIARHVYNMNRTFFSAVDYDEVRGYVQQYLLRNSKSSQSLIESTGRRGYYHLNTKGSPDARQMMLQFAEQQDTDEKTKTPRDLSLNLFD